MANENSTILTAEQEMKLRKPIEEQTGVIQAQIDSLRAEGTDRVLFLQGKIDTAKRGNGWRVTKKLSSYQKNTVKRKPT